MELRDRNGLTEAEFLASYNPHQYETPSVTADILIFSESSDMLKLLMVKRKGHPYLGCWAMPGGFANKNETIDQAALRELEEETHVKGLDLLPVGVFSNPGRDPRGWVITEAFMSVSDDRTLQICADDDASDAGWFQVFAKEQNKTLELNLIGAETLRAVLAFQEKRTPLGIKRSYQILENSKIAFDHAQIIASALDLLKEWNK